MFKDHTIHELNIFSWQRLKFIGFKLRGLRECHYPQLNKSCTKLGQKGNPEKWEVVTLIATEKSN